MTEFGRLDALVNNAGILRDTTLWKMTDEQFDAVVTTHLRGTFTCTPPWARPFVDGDAAYHQFTCTAVNADRVTVVREPSSTRLRTTLRREVRSAFLPPATHLR